MAKQSSIPDELLAQYEKLVKSIPELERKGATMPYTSVNGNMFSFLAKDGSLALRLPADEREAFIKKFKTFLFEANGAVLKEYVAVPRTLQLNLAKLKPYFGASFSYTASLKPKPTTKKKK